MRPRTQSFSMNSYKKYDLIKNSNITKITEKEKALETIKNYNEENLNNLITIPELAHNVNVEVPKYNEIKKAYRTKNPIKFHEKAKLTNFDMKNVEEIKTSEKEKDNINIINNEIIPSKAKEEQVEKEENNDDIFVDFEDISIDEEKPLEKISESKEKEKEKEKEKKPEIKIPKKIEKIIINTDEIKKEEIEMKLSKFNIKKPTAPKQEEPKKKGGKI